MYSNLFILFIAVFICTQTEVCSKLAAFLSKQKPHVDPCNQVCVDLPEDDLEPVCMMFSRYKRGYQHFVNLCHARRAICYENLVLHMVHPSRCIRSGQFYMPAN